MVKTDVSSSPFESQGGIKAKCVKDRWGPFVEGNSMICIEELNRGQKFQKLWTNESERHDFLPEEGLKLLIQELITNLLRRSLLWTCRMTSGVDSHAV